MQAFTAELDQLPWPAKGSRHEALVRIVGWSFGMEHLDLRWAMERIKAEWQRLTAGEGREDEVDELACWVVGQESDQACRPGRTTATRLLHADCSCGSTHPDPFVIPPLRWLVRGLWCADTHGELAGAEKTLKSYIGMILDVGLAAGVPVFGRFGVTSHDECCTWRARAGSSGYWRRFGRVCDAYGVRCGRRSAEPAGHLQHGLDEQSAVRRRECQAQLENYGPALVHPDPYYAFAPASRLPAAASRSGWRSRRVRRAVSPEHAPRCSSTTTSTRPAPATG